MTLLYVYSSFNKDFIIELTGSSGQGTGSSGQGTNQGQADKKKCVDKVK